MSRMNELDLCITDVAHGDENLRKQLVEEINDHLQGIKPFDELSLSARGVIEIWETTNEHEMSYHGGTLGFPQDDDDLLIQEGESHV